LAQALKAELVREIQKIALEVNDKSLMRANIQNLHLVFGMVNQIIK
jgi:hypothetical protein